MRSCSFAKAPPRGGGREESERPGAFSAELVPYALRSHAVPIDTFKIP